MPQPEPAASREPPERLSIEQIDRRYPDEWVALVDDDFDENNMQISCGVVFTHHRDRSVVLERSRHLRDAAIHYTGRRVSFTKWALSHVARKV